MTPREYLEEVVKPLHKDLVDDSCSIARLYASAITTFHIVDYAVEANKEISDKERKRAVDEVRDRALEECPEFKAVYTVATAQKHAITTNKTIYQGIDADEAHRRIPNYITFGGEEITYGDQPITHGKTFGIKVGDEEHDLLKCLWSVICYFDKKIPD